MNTIKTFLLMTLLTLLFIVVGSAVGGESGMMTAFMFAVITNFGTYWFSDKIVLWMYKAQEAKEADYPELFKTVSVLAQKAGLPMPRVYIMDNQTPNAFATGRNPKHGIVAVTTGIMRILNHDELSGVIGHELAHIKNRDILIGTIAATIVGAISMMARWTMFFGGSRDRDRDNNPLGGMAGILVLIITPIAGMLIQMAISRSREYKADEGGARISGNPSFLSGALRKLHMGVQNVPMEDVNPATAHMFIVSPLSGKGMFSLFSTHPPMEERIERLNNLKVQP